MMELDAVDGAVKGRLRKVELLGRSLSSCSWTIDNLAWRTLRKRFIGERGGVGMKSRTLLCSDGETSVAAPPDWIRGASDKGVRNRPDDGEAAGLLAREDKRLFCFQLLDQVPLLSGLAD